MARWIFHADLDAFYASVEQLDDPELRGKPVVVGGSPEARGVVAAASYEARGFGVRSAMPMRTALRLCPEAVRVPPRFDRYGEVSRQVMAIFRDLTPLVEPLSLDEAFLDVSDAVADGEAARRVALDLKRRVREETGLTLSIGAASNKSVAKIASDMDKPDGLVVVPHGGEAEFLAPLPVRALPGVGPRTEALLTRAGVRTAGELVRSRSPDLARALGSRWSFLQEIAAGVDERAVETEHERKSIGAETTFPRDLPDGPELREELGRIAAEVARRLQRGGVRAHTVTLKLRYADFRRITRQSSLAAPVDSADEIAGAAGSLLDRLAPGGDRFRLLGVQCSKLVEHGAQGTLWPAEEHPAAS